MLIKSSKSKCFFCGFGYEALQETDLHSPDGCLDEIFLFEQELSMQLRWSTRLANKKFKIPSKFALLQEMPLTQLTSLKEFLWVRCERRVLKYE